MVPFARPLSALPFCLFLLSSSTFAQAPANDDCSNAEVISTPVPFPTPVWVSSVSFDTTAATDSGVPSPGCPDGGASAQDVWFSYTAPHAGVLLVDACPSSGFTPDLTLYEGDCTGTLTVVSCGELKPDGCAPDASTSIASRVAANVTYLIRLGGNDPGTGAAGTMSIALAPNWSCNTSGQLLLGLNEFDTTVDVLGDGDMIPCGGTFQSLYWQYSPPTSGELTVSTCGMSAVNTTLAVYEVTQVFAEELNDSQTPCNDGAPSLGCSDETPGCANGTSSLTVSLVAGGHYLIGLSNDGLLEGTGQMLAEFTPADCNGNSIPDLGELQQGLVEDWNLNEIPDECEGDFFFRVTTPDQTLSFTPGSGLDIDFTVPFFLEERPANPGFPNGLTGFTLQVENTLPVSLVNAVQPSAALLALNAGQGPDFFQVDSCIPVWRVGVINSLGGNFETLLANGPTEIITVDVTIISPNFDSSDLPTVREIRGVDGEECFALAVNNSVITPGGVLPMEVFPGTIEIIESASSGAFVRSDCNLDGVVDIADVVQGLAILFSGAPLGTCLVACDSNDDDVVDIADPVYSLAILFPGTMPPPALPPISCGTDPTPGVLECVFNLGCP